MTGPDPWGDWSAGRLPADATADERIANSTFLADLCRIHAAGPPPPPDVLGPGLEPWAGVKAQRRRQVR